MAKRGRKAKNPEQGEPKKAPQKEEKEENSRRTRSCREKKNREDEKEAVGEHASNPTPCSNDKAREENEDILSDDGSSTSEETKGKANDDCSSSKNTSTSNETGNTSGKGSASEGSSKTTPTSDESKQDGTAAADEDCSENASSSNEKSNSDKKETVLEGDSSKNTPLREGTKGIANEGSSETTPIPTDECKQDGTPAADQDCSENAFSSEKSDSGKKKAVIEEENSKNTPLRDDSNGNPNEASCKTTPIPIDKRKQEETAAADDDCSESYSSFNEKSNSGKKETVIKEDNSKVTPLREHSDDNPSEACSKITPIPIEKRKQDTTAGTDDDYSQNGSSSNEKSNSGKKETVIEEDNSKGTQLCEEASTGANPVEVQVTPQNLFEDAQQEQLVNSATREEVEVADAVTSQESPKQQESCDDNENEADQHETVSADDQDSDEIAGAGDNSEQEEDEVWEVKKIMSIKDLNDFPIVCSTDSCLNVAALIYTSNLAPTDKWYSCLDCQEDDFGGWPELDELPISFMTAEHKALMRTKCSKRKDIEMPDFPPQTLTTSPSANPTSSHTVTPVPQPCLSGTRVVSNARDGTPLEPKPKVKPAPKPSKEALAMHRKWQEQAEAHGGKDARIVVSKPEAKRLIFDLLHDAFRPLNITQIHKELKAIVPSPVLKACLDDMALDSSSGTSFIDSDDDESNKDSAPPQSSAPYSGSLCFKGAKSPNASLYYVDYRQLKNNGNGLDGVEKSTLYSCLSKAQEEKEFLKASIQTGKASTAQLLSEPTNEQATAQLETQEENLEMIQKETEDARELIVNESTKKQLKRRVEHMTAVWRKRRRLCIEFLNAMEEYTEGTVSAKKCLSGDGQIEIDSDEAVITAALAFAKNKNKKGRIGKKHGRNSHSNSLVPPPSASFVGVKLDPQKGLVRVHIDGEEF